MSTYERLEHSPTQAKDEEFVLRDLVRMIVDQIWWVLGIALGILLVAVLYAKMSTPVYSADALVQVETPSPNSPNSAQAALAAALMPSAGSMHADAETEIIKSRAVIDPVVEQFKLNFGTSANVMPAIGRVTSWFAHKGHPLPALFGFDAYAWGGEEFKVDSVNVPTTLQDQRLTLRALGDGRFALLDAENHELLQGEAGKQHGRDGLRKKHSYYDARFKMSVLSHMWRTGLSRQQVAAAFDIRSPGCIGKWEHQYHDGGMDALLRRSTGRCTTLSGHPRAVLAAYVRTAC